MSVYDPWVDASAVQQEYGIEINTSLPMRRYDAVILAVAHDEFRTIDYSAITAPNHVIYDVKWLLGDVATHKL